MELTVCRNGFPNKIIKTGKTKGGWGTVQYSGGGLFERTNS
jgi:hypothetical protein